MCFSLGLKLVSWSVLHRIHPPEQQFNHQSSLRSMRSSASAELWVLTLTLAFKRLLREWSDCSVPVFWERTIHTAVCGVNAKQTCLTHASPSAVMALLSKPHAEHCLACCPSQSISPQWLWVNAHPCSQADFLINTETSADRDSVTEQSSVGSVLAYL